VRVARCPRCGKPPEEYWERWTDFGMIFSADARGVPERIGYLVDGGPVGVDAICACGYRWCLRGVRQITELRPDETDDPLPAPAGEPREG
jgi:hypothetical protein